MGARRLPSATIWAAALLSVVYLTGAGCASPDTAATDTTSAAVPAAVRGTAESMAAGSPTASQSRDAPVEDPDVAPLADYPFYTSVDELVRAATTIVIGQITASDVHSSTDETIYTVAIDEVIKPDSRTGGLIDFAIPGIAGSDLTPPGEHYPMVDPDRDVLLFLQEYSDGSVSSLVNPDQGIFMVERKAQTVTPVALHSGSSTFRTELTAFVFNR